MPLWCRLRLTWSTFRFRSRDACMTKLGIMTDENTTSQQTQPTEAATEAAAETATDTDAQHIRASAPFHRPGRTVRIRPSAVA